MAVTLTLSDTEFFRLKKVYRVLRAREWTEEHEDHVFPLRWHHTNDLCTYSAEFPSDAAAMLFKLRWL